MKTKGSFTLMLLLVLIGCRANQEPLDEFIRDSKQVMQNQATVLTPVVALVGADYQAHSMRSPFQLPDVVLGLNQPQSRVDCWQPNSRNKKQLLERFPIEKLSLKGVISREGSHSGVVLTPLGELVKVTPGQYIGLNNGEVIEVTDTYLQIAETFPDGLGCWNRRNVQLAME